MVTILIDEVVRSRLEIENTFLAREDWRLVSVAGDWLARVDELRPELVVLAHDPTRVDALALVRELRRNEQGPLKLRILCVLDEQTYTSSFDFLASHSTACLVGRLNSEMLIAAMMQLFNVPTRINVRARVIFELQGRDEDNEIFHGRMLDVSTGGFLFESDSRFKPNERIYCFFSLDRSEPVIFSSGSIVRVSGVPGKRVRYGVEFRDIRCDDRRRIADYVNRQCVDETPPGVAAPSLEHGAAVR